MKIITLANIRNVLGQESFKDNPGDCWEYTWADLTSYKRGEGAVLLKEIGFEKVNGIAGFQHGEVETLKCNPWAAFINENDIVVVDLETEA